MKLRYRLYLEVTDDEGVTFICPPKDGEVDFSVLPLNAELTFIIRGDDKPFAGSTDVTNEVKASLAERMVGGFDLWPY